MKKTAVIYWSGTGNTEAMANAVLEGMKAAGADAALLTPGPGERPPSLSGYDRHRLRLPRHGQRGAGGDGVPAHVRQPARTSMGGKAVALFGSYGWGDGEWMRTWEKDCDDAGINLVVRQRHLLRGPGRRCTGGLHRELGRGAGRSKEAAMDSARKRLRRKLPVLMPTAAVLLCLAIGGSVG